MNIKALYFQNEMNVESYINYPKENITDEPIDDQEIVNLIRHLDDLTTAKELDDSVEICQFTYQEAFDALNKSFFALNSAKNNIKVKYNYLTNYDMFKVDKDTEIKDLELEK
ncbi:6788_t:CDS:2 [Cetraspora pellucida]|uniref:6788_t:CDS:1 n=1 Tax=Cetraspora pellucida TaxID=1433469 RepID=A0A9N8ZZD5_9GLOM|nr:6788_t:CDS:2 [Cetraspora pellucida]